MIFSIYNRIKIVLVLCLVCCNWSCKESKNGFNEKMLIVPELEGSYHTLEDIEVGVFLPKGFSSLAEEDHEEISKRIENEQVRADYMRMVEIQQFSKFPNFNFISLDHQATLSIVSLPYAPFSKREAGRVLYYINRRYDNIQAKYGTPTEKIKSTYSGNKKFQLMNALYKLQDVVNGEQVVEHYENVYFISGKSKTLMMVLSTPQVSDLTDYIKKLKL